MAHIDRAPLKSPQYRMETTNTEGLHSSTISLSTDTAYGSLTPFTKTDVVFPLSYFL